MKKWNWFILSLCTILLIAGCSSENQGSANESQGALKTELNVAINTQPPTLDQHMSTATIISDVSRHIYEQLLALNSDYEVVPMLAESVDESEDGTTFTFNLRQGIMFHNGKEMKAEDVIASLEKWQGISSKAQSIIPDASFTEIDEYTVEFKLSEPVYGVLSLFADLGQSAVIMPKEVAEAAGPAGATEYIGTGPFKFEEWKQDQYIHVSKFEDYSPIEAAVDGLSGKKEALVNDIYFHVVTDGSTRLAGIQTGQYDVAMGIPYDNFDMVDNDPNLKARSEIFGTVGFVYNKKEGIFADEKMRQAVNSALDTESIMLAGYSSENFYRIDPSFMVAEQKEWYTEVGGDRYNVNDPEAAKKLLAEAGYNGEEIKILATKDYDYYYNVAVVIQEQLKAVGVNAVLEVMDWATLLDTRTKPGEYNAFITGFPKVMTPPQLLYLSSQWPGWTEDAEITELMTELNAAGSAEEAKAAYEKLQDRMYDYLPVSKLGDSYNFFATSSKVEGFELMDGLILWNTTVAE